MDLHLRCDNINTIKFKLAKNIVFYIRSKYIELHHYYVKEQILRDNKISSINLQEQITNILIKALRKQALIKHKLGNGHYIDYGYTNSYSLKWITY